ncbi:hypothetical protein BP5796_01272 [Coleophoma crateriformis]|uniref:Yeast cell wall synthesis Kre9/Knh1-like N-terminal domain-containing protein n=1 Tax=Coleophoma crateriformis TaxID=565419 RepID=A0A3D8T1J5_9HELO|nr:hypothetical protein BP5796_01272 [Coleophoma crateriformis]
MQTIESEAIMNAASATSPRPHPSRPGSIATSPAKNTLWNSDNANTITWTSVSTDPTTVDIYLVHQASQSQISDLLFSNVCFSARDAACFGKGPISRAVPVGPATDWVDT